MSYIPNMEKLARNIEEYNKEDFHLKHAEIVSGVMRYFKEYDPEGEEYWAVVGLLHDLDYEMYPDEHCVKQRDEELNLDEGLIKSP